MLDPTVTTSRDPVGQVPDDRAHTPGPWHVTAGPYPREIRADDGPYIASVYDLAVTYGERNANARLLAAAPELLDALKTLLANIEDYQRINQLGGFDNRDQQMARAAIAKAEGR